MHTSEQAQRGQGLRTHNTPSVHIGQQAPLGQGYSTHITTSVQTCEQAPRDKGHHTNNSADGTCSLVCMLGVLFVRCLWPVGASSTVCTLGVSHLRCHAPLGVCSRACKLGVLCVRCHWPLGTCSQVCTLSLLCVPPPLFTCGAFSCSWQGRRKGEPWGASPRSSAPTYLPTYLSLLCLLCSWPVGACSAVCTLGVLCVRCLLPLGACTPVCTFVVLCVRYPWPLGLVHWCAGLVCCLCPLLGLLALGHLCERLPNVPRRPARPTRPRRTSTGTHTRDPGVASSDPQGEVSASIRNSPGAGAESPSNDGRYGKPDASVTGSTHANHRSARSPRPTPEGPARDNTIAGPRTSMTRSEPSAPASAGASGRHNEPGSQPASVCPTQAPSKAGGASPRGGERHHGVTKADRSTASDRTGRGAAHHVGPRGTPERHATGHNQGTRTGAKQQWPHGAANPESAQNTQRTTAREQVLSRTAAVWMDECAPGSKPAPASYGAAAVWMDECAPGGYPAPAGYETAAVRMDECAPGGYPAPAAYEQPPSGWMSFSPRSAPPHTQHTAQHTERADQ